MNQIKNEYINLSFEEQYIYVSMCSNDENDVFNNYFCISFNHLILKLALLDHDLYKPKNQ